MYRGGCSALLESSSLPVTRALSLTAPGEAPGSCARTVPGCCCRKMCAAVTDAIIRCPMREG
eukprot:scaffold11201_cov36-Phaeocystis_antarctica.AAC.2